MKRSGRLDSLFRVSDLMSDVSLQLKFTIIVCYLSTHFNVVLLTAIIFFCNVFIYVIWSRLMSSSRKAKQKYNNPNYEDDEE